jgi:hypothetical protein
VASAHSSHAVSAGKQFTDGGLTEKLFSRIDALSSFEIKCLFP